MYLLQSRRDSKKGSLNVLRRRITELNNARGGDSTTQIRLSDLTITVYNRQGTFRRTIFGLEKATQESDE